MKTKDYLMDMKDDNGGNSDNAFFQKNINSFFQRN